MGITQWWIVDVIGAGLLGLFLLWAVLRTRPKNPRQNERAEEGTRELYDVEEERRRDHTDGL